MVLLRQPVGKSQARAQFIVHRSHGMKGTRITLSVSVFIIYPQYPNCFPFISGYHHHFAGGTIS